MKRTSSFLLSLIVVLVLIFASPLTVLAQDSGGGDTATTEPTPTEEPTDTTPLLITTEGDVIEPGTEELPAETDVAYYCVVDNTAGTADCSNPYTSIANTIGAAVGETLGSGFSLIINLLAGTTIYESATITGTSFNTMDSFALIGLGTSDDPTVVNGNLVIRNFSTLPDNGSVNVNGTPGGLTINGELLLSTITGDVNVYGVNVENDGGSLTGDGININNVSGDVYVSDSTANNNFSTGLNIYEVGGSVNLYNITTNNNRGSGTVVVEARDTSIDNLISEDNRENGLYVESINGDLSVYDAVLRNNDYYSDSYGLTAYGIWGNTSLSQVVATGNWGGGLYLYTGSDIYLDHVTANDNGNGAFIGIDPEDYEGPSGFQIGNDIRIFDSTFNNNYYQGLVAYGVGDEEGCYGPCCDGGCDEVPGSANDYYTYYGDVHLVNVDASYNNQAEYDIEDIWDGQFPAGIYIETWGYDSYATFDNVTANHNGGAGIIAINGIVTANNLQANNNLQNPTTTIFPGTQANVFVPSESTESEEMIFTCAQFNNNNGVGLFLVGDDIVLNGVQAINNNDEGYETDPYIAHYETLDVTEIDDYSECGWETAGEAGNPYTDIVIEVMTDEMTGSGSITATQGLVFKLMEELTDGQKDMLARVAIAPSSAPAGTTFTFTEVPEGDPAALSEGLGYVGRSFTITAVSPDGSELSNIYSYMELLFKVDPAFTAPEGTHLAIAHYNETTGEWDVLSTGLSNGYAYAYSALTGAYALVTVAD